MDGAVPDSLYLAERRRRLAAERMLDHARNELTRAHSALVANADRLSRGYLAHREHNLKLTERQQAVLEQRKQAADRADRARRRLWHALEAMRDGFALFDTAGRLIAANHVWLDLFEAGPDQGPGANAESIFTHAAEEGAFDIEELSPEEWGAKQAARWDVEVIEPQVLTHYDGRVLQVQDRRAPDGDVVSLVIDITEHHAREESLAAARDEAEDLARAKADFLARMSHEIRTPMNGVLGMAQMLMDESDEEEIQLYSRTIRDSAEALLLIVNDTLDVSKLDANKVELRHEDINLEMLLIDCLRLAAANAREGVNTALLYPLGAQSRFRGDEGRIRQIVMNLLGNALKFTSSGHVVLRVSLMPGAPMPITMEVEDTGLGIPADKLDTVFEAFGQVDDPSRPVAEGTGLGLTISRGLAERMGGTLTVASTVGKGTTFTLSLQLEPLEPPEAVPPLIPVITVPADSGTRGDMVAERLQGIGVRVAPEITAETGAIIIPLELSPARQQALLSAVPPDLRVVLLGRNAQAIPELADRADRILIAPIFGGDLLETLAVDVPGQVTPVQPAPPNVPKRLILADDNATNRLILQKMLKDEPFDLVMATNGAEALEAHRSGGAAAVVLDISMPVMDGFEAAQALLCDAKEADVPAPPIIALTAHVGQDMEDKLIAAGFDAYLTKPLKKDLLLEALARLIPQEKLTT